jgi:Helitron helicase-like domain at N-terminus
VRPGFNLLHSAGKLFQQYIVDAYVKTEGCRLQFLRQNQSALRVEQYQGLLDHVANKASSIKVQPGRVIILPSTFKGSPRNMAQNFQVAMAIVRKYGKPDLFITFTCNSQWPEITASLLKGQKAEHRPDLTVRVFHLKLKELMSDLTVKCAFGKPVGYVQNFRNAVCLTLTYW